MTEKFYKVTNKDAKNRGFQLKTGLNQVADFDPNPDKECSDGLYFCDLTQVLYWSSMLKYDHVFDVEIPGDAKVIHFSDKSRADKLILSNLRPISDIQDIVWSMGTYRYENAEKLLRMAVNTNLLWIVQEMYEKMSTATFDLCPIIKSTVERDHVEIAEYLHSIYVVFPDWCVYTAARNASLRVLKFLHRIGKTCTSNDMHQAASRGYLEVVEFFVSVGVKHSQLDIDVAIANGHSNVAEYLQRLVPSIPPPLVPSKCACQ